MVLNFYSHINEEWFDINLKNCTLTHASSQDLSKVIRLKVSGDKEDRNPARSYSYTELLDLQSRLMLVAGQAEKGKDNVDRFITVCIILMTFFHFLGE